MFARFIILSPWRAKQVTNQFAILMYREYTLGMATARNACGCPCKTEEQHSRTVHLVTGNPGKLSEINAIMGKELEGKMVTVDIDLPEYQGDIDEIALMKCKTAFSIVKAPVLIEDTSLCFDALHGLPGPYIKWFLKGCGPHGLVRMLHGFEDKKARAVCAFSLQLDDNGDDQAFQLPDSPFVMFKQGVYVLRGEVEGEIVEPQGTSGFGWDPIFRPAGFEQTYAEIGAEVKNTISHRSKGLALLRQFLSLNADRL